MISKTLACFALVPLLVANQSLCRAAPADGGPMRVAFIVDDSGSMADGQRYPLVMVGMAATLAVMPDGALVTLILFNENSRVLCDAQPLNDKIRSSLLNQLHVKPNGGTDIIGSVNEGLERLPDGGVIVLLSDGQHTGAGRQPMSKAEWGPAVKHLIDRARRQRVTIHAIALSTEADKELLGSLAKGTGGQLFPVSDPKQLVEQYLRIASLVGRFWRRDPGQSSAFDITAPQTVIAVTADGIGEAPLSRILASGVAEKVPAEFAYHHAGITARRYELEPSRYRFLPSVRTSSDLLRPMPFHWIVPQPLKIPANRTTDIEVYAKKALVSADFADLQLVYQTDATETVAVASEGGRFRVPVSAPPQIGGKVRGQLVARQHGFFFDVGRLEIDLGTPKPLGYRARLSDANNPIRHFAWGSKRELQLELVVSSPADAQRGELVLAVSHSRFKVTPERISIDGPESKATITITCTEESSELVTADVLIKARADDVVPPLVNGVVEYRRQLEWCNLSPGLELDNFPITGRPLRVQRGEEIRIPLRVEAKDLERIHVEPGIAIDASGLPAGVELHLVEHGGKDERIVEVIKANSKAVNSLVLKIPPDMISGTHSATIRAFSTDSDVLLNGFPKPLVSEFTLVVEPENVTAALETDERVWEVYPANADEHKSLALNVSTASGRPLPAMNVQYQADPTLRVLEVERSARSASELLINYDLSLQDVSWPSKAEVSFVVVGDQVKFDQPCSFTVVAQPEALDVGVTPGAVQVVAPIEDVRHEIVLFASTKSGRELAPTNLSIRPDNNLPVDVKAGRWRRKSSGKLEMTYELLIRKNAKPFLGAVSFVVCQEGVQQLNPAVVRVEVPEHKLHIRPVTATVLRYPHWYQSIVDRLPCGKQVPLSLTTSGNGPTEGRFRWTVVKRGTDPNHRTTWLNPQDIAEVCPIIPSDVIVDPIYTHTQVKPSTRIPVVFHVVEAGPPWLLLVGVPTLLCLAAFAPWMLLPSVPGYFAVDSSSPGTTPQTIHLGKRRSAFELNGQRFVMRKRRGCVEVNWQGPRPRSENEQSAPCITHDDGLTVLECAEWAEIFNGDKLTLPTCRAEYVTPVKRRQQFTLEPDPNGVL